MNNLQTPSAIFIKIERYLQKNRKNYYGYD